MSTLIEANMNSASPYAPVGRSLSSALGAHHTVDHCLPAPSKLMITTMIRHIVIHTAGFTSSFYRRKKKAVISKQLAAAES